MIKNYALTFILVFYSTTFFAKNNIAFIENKGQIIDQNNLANYSVKYIACNNEMKLQLKENSFSYELIRSKKYKKNNTAISTVLERNIIYHSERDNWLKRINDSFVILSHRIDVVLIGATKHPEIKPEVQSEDYINYYTTCTPEAGVTYVHQYQKVTYQNIYPNIDLEFVLDAANKQTFKYNFIVRPGGKVNDIQLKYSGVDNTNLTPTGSLNITTAYGNLEESIPNSYIAETGKVIAMQYQQSHEGIYGFRAGNYCVQQTLIIDPWCTYFGGGGDDMLSSSCIDGANNIILVGGTSSFSNIATLGSYKTTLFDSLGDGCIIKITSNGNRLWSSYYGGKKNDYCYGVIADNIEQIYVVGKTESDTGIATIGSFQPNYSGNSDGFIVKFNKNGIRKWGTYYGGAMFDYITSISINNINNNIVCLGNTASNNNISTAGSYQVNFGGDVDLFIVKLDSIGQRVWSTYYGGAGDDESEINSISIDSNGYISVCGTTQSSNNIATNNVYQSILIGFCNAFIGKFSPLGSLLWGSYFGQGSEYGYSISFDNSNNIFLCGETGSSNNIATVGASQTVLGGSNDAYIAKFNSLGMRQWSTYYGGEADDVPRRILSDNQNNVFITGGTNSLMNISSSNAFQLNMKGLSDAFVAKYNNNGIKQWSTYFGGNSDDGASCLSIETNKSIILCGATCSDSGLYISNGFQSVFGGGSYDSFIACFDSTGHIPPVGIQNFNETIPSLIKVYPNPANDKITVSIKDYKGKRGSISVVDVMGRAVGTSTPLSDHSLTIDIKQWPSGVYFVQYDDGEVCETVKFVKE